MHFHIDWSSTGLSSDSFDSYAEAQAIGHQIVEDIRSTQWGARALSVLNETFKVEPFDETCPICAKHNDTR
jgi:hypothetical protein